MGNPLKAASTILFSPQIITFAFYVVFQALAVYFNLYFLIPRYLEKDKFLKYISFLSLTLISTALVIVSGYYLSAFIFGINLEKLYGEGTNCFFFFFGEAFPSTIASATLGMSIKLTKNWINIKRSQQLVDKTDIDHIFIKCGNKLEKIYFEDILFIEGMQNYVAVHTAKRKYITLLNMKNLEHNLGNWGFIRVHKSYIVSISKIAGIEVNKIFIGPHSIPISRTYRNSVMEQVVNKQLWNRKTSS